MRILFQRRHLGDCLLLIKNGANIKQDKGTGGIPITRIETLSGGVFNRDRLGYAGIDQPGKYESFILESGDLLFSHINSKAYIGRTVLYQKEGSEVIIHGMNLLRIKVIPELLIPKYLYYTTLTEGFKSQVASSRKDAVNQSSISVSDIKRIIIPVPSLIEQQRIVDELDLLTGIIEKKNAQLRDLDALAQSIFYEMFGDPSESKYPVAKLSSLATGKLSYGSGASAIIFDGQTRYVRITDIQEDGRLSPDAMSPSQYDAKYLLNDGDILFARSGATVGKTYLYDSKDGNAIYAGYLIRLVPNQEIVLPEYIYHFTRSHYYRAFIASNVQAVAQPNINAQQYGNLSVCVPPISEQKVFAEEIHSLESKRDMIWSSIKDTQTLLDSRMSHYFG